MEIFSVLGRALLIVGGFSIGMVVFMMVLTLFTVRRKVQGKVVAVFVEHNNQVSEELLKVDPSGMILSAHGEGDEQYLILADKALWSRWPKGFPTWMQEIVPTFYYERNQAEPYSPKNTKSAITARSLRAITDEGMLRATWKEAGAAIGVGKLNMRSTMMIAGAVVVGAFLILGFMVFKVIQDLTELSTYVRTLS